MYLSKHQNLANLKLSNGHNTFFEYFECFHHDIVQLHLLYVVQSLLLYLGFMSLGESGLDHSLLLFVNYTCIPYADFWPFSW